MNRWPVAIFVSGVLVVAVNIAFIWIAVHVNDPVESSYDLEAR